MDAIINASRECTVKHVLLIFDCCYSGYAALRESEVIKPPNVTDEYLERITSNRAIQVLAAGEVDQPVNDSGERLGFSAFTGALLDIFESRRDLDNDGLLTASEIGSYLGPIVSRTIFRRRKIVFLDVKIQYVFRTTAIQFDIYIRNLWLYLIRLKRSLSYSRYLAIFILYFHIILFGNVSWV
jgi:hypothetical protein